MRLCCLCFLSVHALFPLTSTLAPSPSGEQQRSTVGVSHKLTGSPTVSKSSIGKSRMIGSTFTPKVASETNSAPTIETSEMSTMGSVTCNAMRWGGGRGGKRLKAQPTPWLLLLLCIVCAFGERPLP